jgi:hypothetical protein
VSEWQPIETAPKDGTYILVAWTEWPIQLVTRFTHYHNLDSGDVTIYPGFWQSPAGGALKTPTHWMPLPDPPAEQK